MTPVPTVRLALVAVASAAVALVLPVPFVVGIVIVDGALVAVALVDARAAPGRRDVSVVRSAWGALAVDADAELTWTVSNTGARSAAVEFADAVPPSFGVLRRRLAVTVPAGAASEVRVRAHPTRRGRHLLSTLALRSTGPLGLAARQWRVETPVEVNVVPRLRSRDMVEQAVAAARRMQLGEKRPVAVGGATEFESLRDYTPDDEYRRIDWAATARRARPIVRTYRTPQYQTVLCLVDTGRVMSTAVSGSPRLEHAIEGVLALSTLATRLGDRVGLVAFDRTVRGVVAPSAHPGHVRALTEGLFDLQPALVESDYAGAVRDALTRLHRRALVVVFTDVVEGAVEESLVPALPTVLARHLLVVAATHEPGATRRVPVGGDRDTGAAERTDAPSVADVHLAVAARRALAARDRHVARLEALGARVVDATADRFAADLVDVYLEIKATGRL